MGYTGRTGRWFCSAGGRTDYRAQYVIQAFYFDITPYQICASGIQLTALPMIDEVYQVCHLGKALADLYPEITAAGICWNGFGQLSHKLAEEKGLQIFAYEI